MFKKILPIIISLVMVLSVFPASAFASPEDPDTEPDFAEEQVINITDGDVSIEGFLPEGAVVEASEISTKQEVRSYSKTALKTAAKSTVYLDAKSEIADDLELNSITNDKFAAVYDIKLRSDGIEIQPEDAVTVTINNVALTGSTATVYHILEDVDAIYRGQEEETVQAVTSGALYDLANENALNAAYEATGEENTVYVETITANVEEGTVTFEATSFSVYAIEVGGEIVEYRRTYQFEDIKIAEDSTYTYESYDFMNKAGQTVDNQIIKDGDALEKVPAPYHSGYKFQGWYIWNGDDAAGSWGDAVSFETPISLDISANETVKVRARYENVYFITFHQNAKGSTDDVILTRKAAVAGSDGTAEVLISDAIAPQPNEDHIFYGWFEGNKTDPTIIYDDQNVVVETKATISGSIDMWPYFVEAYWLHYVAGESGSGALYVESRFVLASETLYDLPTTTRRGYTFLGWYEGSMSDTGSITYGAQVTDGSGHVLNPASGLKLTSEKTLYGNWEADNNATYSVVIWAQKATDKKEYTDSQKHYDYVTSYSRTGTTGDPAIPSDSDMNFPTVDGMNWTGFHYSRYVQNYTTIQANGSTVIEVFYDRDLKTINYYYRDGDQPEGAIESWNYIADDSDSNNPQKYGVLEDGTYVPLTRSAPQTVTRVYYTYDALFQRYEYTGTFYTREWVWDWFNSGYVYTATQYNGTDNLPPNNNTTYWTEDLGALTNDGHYQLTRRTTSYTTYGWTYTIDGVTYEYTGTRYRRESESGYPYMVTWVGLYGQSFEESDSTYVWPSSYQWNEAPDGTGTTQTFLTGFIQTTEPYKLYDRGTTGSEYIYHYKQGTDGRYSQATGSRYTARAASNMTRFSFSDKFEGFRVASYSTGNNGFSVNGGSAAVSDGDQANISYPLHIYHKRNQWTITYKSQAENSSVWEDVYTTESIYFEQPLTVYNEDETVQSTYNYSIEQIGLDERDHYEFAGWYADQTCTTPFNFDSTMPDGNIAVYAKWEPKYYQINVDPNGGTFTAESFSTYLWLPYGASLGKYNAERVYIEDPDGEYVYRNVTFNGVEGNVEGETTWTDDGNGLRPANLLRKAQYIKATDILDDEGNLKAYDGDGIYAEVLLRYDQIFNYTDTTKRYRMIDPASDPTYTLVGWYEVQEDGTVSSTPFDFSEEIARPVTIQAKWHLGGAYKLQYTASRTIETSDESIIAVAATCAQDDGAYSDGAKTITLAGPTLTYEQPVVFDGWEIGILKPDGSVQVLDNNQGNYYQPGDEITINGAYSVNKVINLIAHYTYAPESNEPVDVTTLVLDANGGTTSIESGTGITVNDALTTVTYYPLQINSAFDLNTVTDKFTREGYTLKGWNHVKTAADQGEVEFATTTVVGMDNLNPDENTLYAVWEKTYTTLKITKSATGVSDADQSFVFNVKGTAGTPTAGVNLTVSVKAGESVTIGSLLPGTYTVTENESWSWRYDFQSMTLNDTAVTGNTINLQQNENGNELVVTNSRVNPYWLAGDAVATNNFAAKQSTSTDPDDPGQD